MIKRMSMWLVAALIASIAVPVYGQVLFEDFKLVASDGGSSDWFGSAVANDGSIVVIGAIHDDENGDYSGSVYLFDASTGMELRKITPADGTSGDRFGCSVDIDSGVVAVGAYGDDDFGTSSGSVYLFDASSGLQLAKLNASDAMPHHWFGYSVAIDDGVVAAGITQTSGSLDGAIYLFDSATGIQLSRVDPVESSPGDRLGWSLAMDAGILVAGAYRDSTAGFRAGAVYLMAVKTGSLTKVPPPEGTSSEFGRSVAVAKNHVVVGAPGENHDGRDSGSSYILDTSGKLLWRINSTDAMKTDTFGISVSIDESSVLIGANQNDQNGSNSGAAYIFDIKTGQELKKLSPSDGAKADRYGSAVSLNNGLAVIGAYSDDDNGGSSGSAYVYGLSCPADFTGDGALDIFDVFAFLDLFNAQDPAADFTGDGSFDIFDIFNFLDAFNAGCPLAPTNP